MSENRELAEREVYVVPHVGTVVSLENPGEAARALDDVREMEEHLKEAKRILTEALVHAATLQGTKTMHLGSMTVVVSGGSQIVWDVQALESGLLDAGAPQSLVDEIISTEIRYKVNAARATRAAGVNEDYKAVIEAARHDVEKPHSIVISKPPLH